MGGSAYPRLVEAVGAFPPENVGGPWGIPRLPRCNRRSAPPGARRKAALDRRSLRSNRHRCRRPYSGRAQPRQKVEPQITSSPQANLIHGARRMDTISTVSPAQRSIGNCNGHVRPKPDPGRVDRGKPRRGAADRARGLCCFAARRGAGATLPSASPSQRRQKIIGRNNRLYQPDLCLITVSGAKLRAASRRGGLCSE